MTTKTLTDSAIKALSPGDTLWDAKVPGLHVRVSLKANKSYYLFYRTKAGVSRRPKLGDCNILDVGQARDIARDSLAVVAAGGDPGANRARSRLEPTVAVLFERCFLEHWSPKKYAPDVRRLFDCNIKPRLGGHRVRAIGYDDVAGLHRAMQTTPVEANRTLAVTSKMLNLAERYGERAIGSNPCRHVARYPEKSRKRFAKAPELAMIGQQMDVIYQAMPASVTFIALLIFTGMRPSEVAAARREWIVEGVLRLPDSKTGPREVYLSSHALNLIERLPAPADGTLTGIQYPRRVWKRIREAAGAPDLWLYDLRRTFATVSLGGGQSLSLIGEVLGHKTAQTTKVYARLMEGPAGELVARTGERMQALLGR